ncbi:MAG: secondary thiamine-phosphate synthase enzyme YjbQ [Candidatus Kapaibacterium sp.]
MKLFRKEITLKERSRGFHLITDEINSAIGTADGINDGIANIFIQHTSAGLTINENADPSVRRDFETFFDRLVPEDTSLYEHTTEGPDDMTSHIKSSQMGSSLTIPYSGGRLLMGTWQGIFLCEFRNRPHRRKIIISIMGE